MDKREQEWQRVLATGLENLLLEQILAEREQAFTHGMSLTVDMLTRKARRHYRSCMKHLGRVA